MGNVSLRYLAALVIAVLAGPSYAETMADPSGIAGIENQRIDKSAPALAAGVAACNRTYAEHNCGALKDQTNVINCSHPEGWAPAQIGLGCVKGGATAIWNTAKGIVTLPYDIGKAIAATPSALKAHGEREQRCMEDQEYKKSLIAPIKMLGRDAPAAITSWSCNQVRDYVENIARRQDEIIAKKRLAQRQFESDLRSRGEDKRAFSERLYPEASRKLTPQEEEYVKANEDRQKAEGALKKLIDEINRVAPCYTNQYKAKVVCQAVGEVAAGTAAGVAIVKYAPRAVAALGRTAGHADDVPVVPRAPGTPETPAGRPPTQPNDPVKTPGRVAATDADDAARSAVPRDAETPRPVREGETPRDTARPTPAATELDDAARVTRAEEAVGRKLNDAERDAVARAHRVGDEVPDAHRGNYTPAQIREKAEILRDAGFTAAERRSLMESGIVGREPPRAPIFSDRPLSHVAAGDEVAVPRSNGGFSNGVVREIDGDNAIVRFRAGDGRVYDKTVPTSELRSAIAAGDDVSIPRSNGTRTNGTVHALNDDGTAVVRFTENGVPKEKAVPLDRLRAAEPDVAASGPRGPPAAAARPERPDFEWFKSQAKTDADIRHFLANAPDSEFKKFMADYKPARFIANEYGVDEARHMLQRGNYMHALDQRYIAPNAPRGLSPPVGDITATSTRDGARHIYTANDGSPVGYVDIKRASQSEIHVDGMRTFGQYNGRGVGDQLLGDVIRSHPEVSRYSAELRFSNQRAIQAALDSGMSERQAIMQSPFYKSMQRLGFDRIISYRCHGGGACDVVLGR